MTTMAYTRLALMDSDFENPRTASGLGDEEIEELASSIALNGLLEPLLVTPDGLILGGQRRYRAVGLLLSLDYKNPNHASHAGPHADEWERAAERFRNGGVPVRIVDVRDAAEAEVIAIVHNDHENLSSYEFAVAVQRLRRHLSQKEIARRLSRSEASISQYCRAWQRAAEPLKLAWQAGEVTFDEVRDLAKRPAAAQSEAVAAKREGQPANPRGPRGRPGIGELRELVEQLGGEIPVRSDERRAGALAVAKWAIGEIDEAELWDELGPKA